MSGTRLTALAPAHPQAVVDTSVTTPAGTSATTDADPYGFGAPVVASFSPGSGPTGSVVTINGQTFVPGATVSFWWACLAFGHVRVSRADQGGCAGRGGLGPDHGDHPGG